MNFDTLARNLLFSTVRIRNMGPNGISVGTSFFLSKPIPGAGQIPALITNKHVVEGAQTLVLDFVARDPSEDKPLTGQGFEVPIAGIGTWIGHPDPNVDVAAIPIASILQQCAEKIFTRPLGTNLLPQVQPPTFIDAIEEVTFVGYPNGHRDELHRTPIVRRGITATPIEQPLDGQPRFLVDGSVFGGSSGSPVFLYQDGTYRASPTTVAAGTRLVLVGIISATVTRNQALPVEVNAGPHVKLAQELNLGVAYNWTTIAEMMDILQGMAEGQVPTPPAVADVTDEQAGESTTE